jgi:predicted metal-dependent phosphoesterase TrpH
MTDAVRLDLHVHASWSPDSRLGLEQIVARLPYAGLRGFALTDHNTVEGHAALRDLKERFPNYLFLPGVEISTREGHLLAYGVREAPPVRRSVAETIDWVRAQGGEAVIAHPFRRAHGVGRRVAEGARVPAFETKNGHNSEIVNLRAENLAAHRGLGMTGGSDAHAAVDVGRAFTEFDPSVASVDDLLEALRRGHVGATGASLAWAARLRLGFRTGLLLASRGFRPI